ncbi:anoctamin-5 [Sabethes cyaneus]|uniref:anoctamin-5 n=1 Tax=Sabethes cyaneus TaxID=53552 RepID=UPI00237E6658|nr:anoctamin-5 [Sabethes cyaneus]XP_053682466.1 anoctamin-5 [Sabethes cyaneus]XP_053682467.1 anoctamin-5 [Sabethes cyaneus]XP_053682468.1 anoctamin-5 [Sabethes cyaneus]XP_053682470.1 anoctamin-5 [Sabethes cyaneus]XP_053682471.1 anoctamin-5 [Sabethes cyaneus]XP_053682472.1 anoctamin-5 [Sabethes cyaneus]
MNSMYRKVSQLDDGDKHDLNDDSQNSVNYRNHHRQHYHHQPQQHHSQPHLYQQQQQQPLLFQNQPPLAVADSTGSLDFDYYEDMDERDSIYLDAVSLSSDGTQRKSLYLSRQTVYHSAEELPLDATTVVDGSDMVRSIQATTEALLNDSRTNGGLPNMPYETPRSSAGPSSVITGGILKRPGLTTKYNEETWNRFQDGNRVVDFILAFNGQNQSEVAARKRATFQQNLIAEGLEIELETSQRIHFVKIHVPREVVSRYCEIMKMRMPIVKLKDQENIIPKDFSLSSTLARLFRRPLFKFVIIDRDKFQKKEYQLQHEYCREKSYLFDDGAPEFFTPSIRIAVAHFILERTYFSDSEEEKFDIGLRKLLNDGVYLDAYPLHDGSPDLPELQCQRTLLLQEWASVVRWIKHQPLDHIKEYFGVKIAMYFAWLGFYTHMLISASVVGLICFFFGLLTFRNNRISQEICNDSGTIMCPQCDAKCDYWYLNTTCTTSQLAYIFDNNFTIAFAVFMSIWATLYLEMWKRYSSAIQHRWGVTDYCSLAEPPRPQYLARLKNSKKTIFNIVTGTQEPSPPFWSKRFPSFLYSYSVIFLFIVLAIAAVFGIVVYRMSLMTSRNIYGTPDTVSSKLVLLPATAAVINLLVSTALNYAYDYVAVYMTDIEYRRTQSEYNESLTLKIYLFQFINYYSSIFYIAFMKGKFPGYPAKYNRILTLRQEECSPGGCLMELCIQLAIIMIGKQLISLILEILLPFLLQKFREFRSVLGIESEDSENGEKLICCNQWTKDFTLISWHDRSLFEEYLKMIIQYGFITIFVVAFPLAPLFALLNNVFETRLDAKKFLLYYKRAVPQRVRDIGIWYNVMHVLGKIAVISSAFIIAFSSNFIPRLVYMYVVSQNKSDVGFVNHTLAYFNVSDFEPGVSPIESKFENVTECRYQEYRNPPGVERAYKRPLIYWHILAIRLAFVVIYQNVVSFVQIVVAWAIPDTPGRLQDQIKREQYLTNEFIIKREKQRTQERKCGGGLQRNGKLALSRQQSSPGEYRTTSIGSIEEEENVDPYAMRQRHRPASDPVSGHERFQECEIVTSRV